MCVCQVTLDCPGNQDSPQVDKLVERIFHCSCQSCSKEGGQEGAVMQLYPADNVLEAASSPEPVSVTGGLPDALPPAASHSRKHAHVHADHHTLPRTSDGG